MEAQQTPLRTAIMRIMSDMLDSADEHGIYETGRFMDRIEQLLCDMMVAPEVLQLSGSEAVFGLLAWLTTRDETTVLGPSQDVDVTIVERFIEANGLTEPREAWHELLTHPKEPEPEVAPASAPAPLEFGGLILATLSDILDEEKKEADAFGKDEEGPIDEPEDSQVALVTLFNSDGEIVAEGTLEEVLFSLTSFDRKVA